MLLQCLSIYLSISLFIEVQSYGLTRTILTLSPSSISLKVDFMSANHTGFSSTFIMYKLKLPVISASSYQVNNSYNQ